MGRRQYGRRIEGRSRIGAELASMRRRESPPARRPFGNRVVKCAAGGPVSRWSPPISREGNGSEIVGPTLRRTRAIPVSAGGPDQFPISNATDVSSVCHQDWGSGRSTRALPRSGFGSRVSGRKRTRMQPPHYAPELRGCRSALAVLASLPGEADRSDRANGLSCVASAAFDSIELAESPTRYHRFVSDR